MAEDMVVFQKPEDLCKWLAIKKSDVSLERHEASIIFNYMESHGCKLGFDGDRLLCHGITGRTGKTVSYSIDEVIDLVCEWNYESIQEATHGMANPADYIDFCENKDKYDSLKEDETKLDAMFVRTKFGRQTLEAVRNTIMEAGLVPAGTEPKAGEPKAVTVRDAEEQERVR